MFKTTIIGAILSLIAAASFGYYMAAPYIAANAPAEWSWLLVPAGAFLAGLVVFWVGWFLTVLATQAVAFRGEFA